MSLLSYKRLCSLIDNGVILNSKHENVNSSSIDVTLGDTIMLETPHCGTINMLDKNSYHLETVRMTEEGFFIPPGGFFLAHTVEVFNLPNNISAEYKLKSTMARNCLNHFTAGWADAGWNGSVLTLEFKNDSQFKEILIKPGMKCGQMIFFEHDEVPSDFSYSSRGSYNNDKSVSSGKGLK